MSISGISNNATAIMPIATTFKANNLSQGNPLGVNKHSRYDTVELSLSTNETTSNIEPKPLIHVSLEEVRGRYIDGKYVPAIYEVTIDNFKDKILAITKEPQTEETLKAIMGYASSFDYKMRTDLFGAEYDIFSKVIELSEEMIENGTKNIENISENINTKFTVEGTEFSLDELLNVSSAMKHIKEFHHGGTADYQAKAREAVITAYLEREDTGFTSAQNNVLKSIFRTMVARWDTIEEEKIKELSNNHMQNIVSELDDYYYGNGYNLTANEELVDNIKDIFSKVTTKEDLEQAVAQYGELMKPLYEITEKLSLPYSNEYINYVEKETVKHAEELLSFWDKPLF